ncbi:hypothetical protein CYY_000437 [Polysphondylium violaceum]|uniref:Uncharacterized protein n=1 Tax=Polysphondylium violaceum TaxID=133409 RepID=A0A8J4Q3T1_9MYCE|nr:hypothetical protein CYY_000437 [Polysphondylium violaceum]
MSANQIIYDEAINVFNLINSGFEGYYSNKNTTNTTITPIENDESSSLTFSESKRLEAITRFRSFYESKMLHMINMKEYKKFFCLVLLEPSTFVLKQSIQDGALLARISGYRTPFEHERLTKQTLEFIFQDTISIFNQEELNIIQHRLDCFYSVYVNLNSYVYPININNINQLEIPTIPIEIIQKYHKYLASQERVESSLSLSKITRDVQKPSTTSIQQILNNKLLVLKIFNHLIEKNNDQQDQEQQQEEEKRYEFVLLEKQDLNNILNLMLLSRNCFEWCKSILNDKESTRLFYFKPNLRVPYGTEFNLFKQPCQVLNYQKVSSIPYKDFKDLFENLRYLVLRSEDFLIGGVDVDEWSTLIAKQSYLLYPSKTPNIEYLEIHEYCSQISSYQHLIQRIISNGEFTQWFNYTTIENVILPNPGTLVNSIKHLYMNICNEEDSNDTDFHRYLIDLLLLYHPSSIESITIDMGVFCQSFHHIYKLYIDLKKSHPTIKLNIHVAKQIPTSVIMEKITTNSRVPVTQSIQEFINQLKEPNSKITFE